MTGRTLPKTDYAALKTSTKILVDRSGGPALVAEHVTRVQKSTISKYYLMGEEHEGTFAPVDAVADMEAHIGDPIVTRQLAALSGFLLVPMPTAKGAANWMAHLTGLLSDDGKVELGLSQATLDDGRVSRDEARDLRPKVMAAMERLASLGNALDRVIEGEQP